MLQIIINILEISDDDSDDIHVSFALEVPSNMSHHTVAAIFRRLADQLEEGDNDG